MLSFFLLFHLYVCCYVKVHIFSAASSILYSLLSNAQSILSVGATSSLNNPNNTFTPNTISHNYRPYPHLHKRAFLVQPGAVLRGLLGVSGGAALGLRVE